MDIVLPGAVADQLTVAHGDRPRVTPDVHRRRTSAPLNSEDVRVPIQKLQPAFSSLRGEIIPAQCPPQMFRGSGGDYRTGTVPRRGDLICD